MTEVHPFLQDNKRFVSSTDEAFMSNCHTQTSNGCSLNEFLLPSSRNAHETISIWDMPCDKAAFLSMDLPTSGVQS
jgi:hypothetical protein